jgi:hypothetical protein
MQPSGRAGTVDGRLVDIRALAGQWISDLISVATVTGGVVTPGNTGMTTIRANVDGVSDTARVWVVPPIANPYP